MPGAVDGIDLQLRKSALSVDAVHMHAQLLAYTAAFCKRVTEECDVSRMTITRRIEFTFELPAAVDRNEEELVQGMPGLIDVPVPVLGMKRGRSIDNCTITDGARNELTVLARSENQRLSAIGIFSAARYLLRHLIVDPESLGVVNRTAYRFAAVPFEDPTRATILAEHLLQTDGLGYTSSGLTEIRCFQILRSSREFSRLVKLLARFYFITAVVPGSPGQRVLIRAQYQHPYFELNSNLRIRDFVRSLAGHSPHAFRFPLALMTRSSSYHFRMSGPSDHFVREQSVRKLVTSQSAGTATPRTVGRYDPVEPPKLTGTLLGRPSSPTGNVHLYVGEGARDPRTRYSARLVFYEVPPGTQGLTALLASVGALITLAFLWNLETLVRNGSVISGVPALFLAIPGTFSIFSFPSSAADRIQQAPLRARVGLGLTAAASIGGAFDLVILCAHQYGSLSGVTWSLWWLLLAVFVAVAIWNVFGMRFNMKCLNEAIDIANQKADTYSSSDYLELQNRDSERGRDGKD